MPTESFVSVASSFVRKHRAPKAALRPPILEVGSVDLENVRKHRAPKGALRRLEGVNLPFCAGVGQKAPSAKRCIKTCDCLAMCSALLCVRKHRAPNGALRRAVFICFQRFLACQKAPSAKRCIKTLCEHRMVQRELCSQKAPSAKRCIKTIETVEQGYQAVAGQKAPSAKRCIKTWLCHVLRLRGQRPSESTERQKVH